jgi:vacuolar-type H+-ATPase catalytic subunit A/Vma1
MSKIKDVPVTANVMDLVRKVDELVLVVRANNNETQVMRQLVGKEYRIVHNDMHRTSEALSEIVKIIGTDKIKEHVADTESKCRTVQRMLQAQIIRSATLTEVTRFIRIEEPTLLMDCMQKLLDLHDKPDSWWEARKLLAVWEWGAMLYPQFRFAWKSRYHIADAERKPKSKSKKVEAPPLDDFDDATPIEDSVPDEESEEL